MRVLHVLPTLSPTYGGPVSGASAIAKFSTQQGVPSFVYPPWGTWGGGRSLAYLPGPAQFACLVRQVKSMDIVMVHGIWTLATSIAALLAGYHAIPYIVNLHGMLDRWSLRRSRWKKQFYGALIERSVLRRASGMRFLNEEELEEARDFGLEAPAFILPNGVAMDEFADLPSRNNPASPFHHLQNRTVVLFLGRLHSKKGLSILIPALAQARQVQPDLHLILAGPDEGGFRKQVERWAVKHGLTGSVTFTGMVTGQSKREVLGAADFFVLPSYQEGDSLAVKEAMAASLPVLITPACHMPEVAEQNSGLIVEPNEGQVAEALIVLASDRNILRTMGTNGRRLMERKYGWKSIVGQFIEIYGDILRGEFSSAAWRLI